MKFLKRFALKYLPISRKQHKAELDQLRSQLVSSYEYKLQETRKALDEVLPKLVRISLENGSSYSREHRLQIILSSSMMHELNYSSRKELIASAIGRMAESEILRLQFVFIK